MKTLAYFTLVFGLLVLSCNRAPEHAVQVDSDENATANVELLLHELGELKSRLARLQQNHTLPLQTDTLLDLEIIGSSAHSALLNKGNFLENLEQLLGEYRYREAQLANLLRSEQRAAQRSRQRVEWWKNELETAQRDIDRLVFHLGELESEICERDAEITKLEDELNRVYFAFGSVKELEQNGVVNAQKSLWGKPRAVALKSDFNKAYFSEADLRTLREIPVLSSRAEVLSLHPADSFRLRGEDGVEAIEIIDPDRFWQHSNYLAVWVE